MRRETKLQSPSPELRPALRRKLWRVFVPGLLFLAVTVLAGLHTLDSLDIAIGQVIQKLWVTPFAGAWFIIGTVGSAEMTPLSLIPLLFVFWRSDRSLGLWFVAIFVAGNLIELLLKHFLSHAAPFQSHNLPQIFLPDYYVLRHVDQAITANSYPSGHMIRTLLVVAALVIAFPDRWVLALSGVVSLFVALGHHYLWGALDERCPGGRPTWLDLTLDHGFGKASARRALNLS